MHFPIQEHYFRLVKFLDKQVSQGKSEIKKEREKGREGGKKKERNKTRKKNNKGEQLSNRSRENLPEIH